jgi:hypothetical protein
MDSMNTRWWLCKYIRSWVFGREAIKKRWADRLQKVHFSDLVDTVDEDSPHIIGTDGKEVWATGGWSATIKGENFVLTPNQGILFQSSVREMIGKFGC